MVLVTQCFEVLSLLNGTLGKKREKSENFSCFFSMTVVFYHGDKGRSSAEKVGQIGQQTW